MIKNIIFDFDGVILDSIPVKTEAFRKLFKTFPEEKVSQFIEFHLVNGGMSRYKKIEYFFNRILQRNIENEQVHQYAKRYSEITKKELAQDKYLIMDSMGFIKENYERYNMHIASGADEEDLKYICRSLDLNRYFSSIHGSPKVKSEIVKNILVANKYKKNETILIGDSFNDQDAAKVNNIAFYGYNNIHLRQYKYIENFKGVVLEKI